MSEVQRIGRLILPVRCAGQLQAKTLRHGVARKDSGNKKGRSRIEIQYTVPAANLKDL
jgi:hypothetical protein